jgi:hypothetical protein
VVRGRCWPRAGCSTVDVATVWPSRVGSPWILRWPPSVVLVREPQDELADRDGCRWSAGFRASGCVVPFPGDESAVPGQQGRRRDGKDRCPPVTGDELGEGAEPEPVRGLVAQACAELAVQDPVLVSQDQELGVPAGLTTKQDSGNREQVPGHAVQQRDDHARIVSTGTVGPLTSSDEYLGGRGSQVCGDPDGQDSPKWTTGEPERRSPSLTHIRRHCSLGPHGSADRAPLTPGLLRDQV